MDQVSKIFRKIIPPGGGIYVFRKIRLFEPPKNSTYIFDWVEPVIFRETPKF